MLIENNFIRSARHNKLKWNERRELTTHDCTMHIRVICMYYRIYECNILLREHGESQLYLLDLTEVVTFVIKTSVLKAKNMRACLRTYLLYARVNCGMSIFSNDSYGKSGFTKGAKFSFSWQTEYNCMTAVGSANLWLYNTTFIQCVQKVSPQ